MTEQNSRVFEPLPCVYAHICRIPPSQGCGPWRVYSKQEDYYMYTVVTDAIDELNEAVQTVFSILTN